MSGDLHVPPVWSAVDQRERLVLANARNWAHDSTACPWCMTLTLRQEYGRALGHAAAINDVASGR